MIHVAAPGRSLAGVRTKRVSWGEIEDRIADWTSLPVKHGEVRLPFRHSLVSLLVCSCPVHTFMPLAAICCGRAKPSALSFLPWPSLLPLLTYQKTPRITHHPISRHICPCEGPATIATSTHMSAPHGMLTLLWRCFVFPPQPFNLLHYAHGQHYDSHYDAFDETYGPQATQRVSSPDHATLPLHCVHVGR